jgi:hypothetical protein
MSRSVRRWPGKFQRLEWGAVAGSLVEDVVGSEHSPVGAGGAEVHRVAGELVEKVGFAPAVEQGAVGIEQGFLRGEERIFFGLSPRRARVISAFSPPGGFSWKTTW